MNNNQLNCFFVVRLNKTLQNDHNLLERSEISTLFEFKKIILFDYNQLIWVINFCSKSVLNFQHSAEYSKLKLLLVSYTLQQIKKKLTLAYTKLLFRLSIRKLRNICARGGFFFFRQISTF